MRNSAYAALIWAVLSTGCASLVSNEIHLRANPNPDSPKIKYAAAIRVAGYIDARQVDNPRKLGDADARIAGLSGADVLLDRAATDIVVDAIGQRLDEAGIQTVPKDDPGALFELSGVIRELRYDVKMRDYVSVKVETTLKELPSGKVIWAGEVAQYADRFAGVSGNTKGDIADYLEQALGVVTGKTIAEINSALMKARPDLFSLAPNSGATSGVTVFVAPSALSPAIAASSMPKNHGRLLIRTLPSRAKIYVDSVYYGMSPLSVEAESGIHTIEIKLKGYQTVTEKVSVRQEESTELELELIGESLLQK